MTDTPTIWQRRLGLDQDAPVETIADEFRDAGLTWSVEQNRQLFREVAAREREGELAALRAALESANGHLLNLLARIHRDGGQYTEEHGLDKSVADANARVATLNADKGDLVEQLERVAAERAAAKAAVQQCELVSHGMDCPVEAALREAGKGER